MNAEEYPERFGLLCHGFDAVEQEVIFLVSEAAFEPGGAFPGDVPGQLFALCFVAARPSFSSEVSGNLLAGAVAAVFHDVLIVLGVFSILYKFMPFDMEIGQSFIAAILTVVGYSLNDTVVIFDRIREYADNSKSLSAKLVDKALSSTLGRTINTSLTTLLVMLAIFFFGGDSIKGFMFALIIGVLVGTYSSLFVATPIMFDADTKKDKEEIK